MPTINPTTTTVSQPFGELEEHSLNSTFQPNHSQSNTLTTSPQGHTTMGEVGEITQQPALKQSKTDTAPPDASMLKKIGHPIFKATAGAITAVGAGSMIAVIGGAISATGVGVGVGIVLIGVGLSVMTASTAVSLENKDPNESKGMHLAKAVAWYSAGVATSVATIGFAVAAILTQGEILELLRGNGHSSGIAMPHSSKHIEQTPIDSSEMEGVPDTAPFSHSPKNNPNTINSTLDSTKKMLNSMMDGVSQVTHEIARNVHMNFI